MTEKTDLDYAHEALEIDKTDVIERIEMSHTYALLSIAGSLARLVELTETASPSLTPPQASVQEQDTPGSLIPAFEALRAAVLGATSLRAREAEGRSQSAGQPLPSEIVETLVDYQGNKVGTVRIDPEMEDQGNQDT